MNRYEKYSWAQSPEPIPKEQIAETVTCDAVVCGAGMSGIAAALSAVENGLKTVLLEKGNTYSARGYHFGAANSRLLKEHGVVNDVDAMAKEWLKVTASRVNESLVRKWLETGLLKPVGQDLPEPTATEASGKAFFFKIDGQVYSLNYETAEPDEQAALSRMAEQYAEVP